jgi:hypothetical protein
LEFSRETEWRLAITVYLNRVVELAKLVGGTKIRHWPKNWEKESCGGSRARCSLRCGVLLLKSGGKTAALHKLT